MRCLVLGSSTYFKPFSIRHHITSNLLESLPDADYVVFTGGTDVNPSLYGDTKYITTNHPDVIRDCKEEGIFKHCLKNGIPMVGICRGAQFLNVMNGGKLIQDVDNHGTHHRIVTNTGLNIGVTSTHHQMMIPTEEAILLAWAKGLSNNYRTGGTFKPILSIDKNAQIKEPEVVWYPKTKCLCVQYHPEYMTEETTGWQYFQELLTLYLEV